MKIESWEACQHCHTPINLTEPIDHFRDSVSSEFNDMCDECHAIYFVQYTITGVTLVAPPTIKNYETTDKKELTWVRERLIEDGYTTLDIDEPCSNWSDCPFCGSVTKTLGRDWIGRAERDEKGCSYHDTCASCGAKFIVLFDSHLYVECKQEPANEDDYEEDEEDD